MACKCFLWLGGLIDESITVRLKLSPAFNLFDEFFVCVCVCMLHVVGLVYWSAKSLCACVYVCVCVCVVGWCEQYMHLNNS